MSTRAAGVVLSPVSGFQFTVHTVPRKGYNFLPEGEVGFSEVSGLQDETEAVKYKDGNDLYPDMLAGQTSPSELTLRRGTDTSNYLEVWRNAVKERTVLPNGDFRLDVIVTLWNRQGAPGTGDTPSEKIKVWRFQKAWPRSLSLGDLNGTSSEINVSEMVLCYQGAAEQVFPPLT